MTADIELLKNSLFKLKKYIEKEDFKGYDPNDALNSFIPFRKFGKWIPILLVQLQKRNPVNLRSFLGIRKGYNPKAMGLLLHAYSILYEIEPSSGAKEKMDFLFQWLIENYSEGYSGYCWGYNFDWASPAKYLPAYTPSIVVTGFIAKGIFKYYQLTKNSKALEVLKSVCQFILNDLPLLESKDGLCFSYTPVMQDCCYNANMLGAEILIKLYSVTGESRLMSIARRSVDFTLTRQKIDGRWNYSRDINTGREREQIDFHQGYVLESLHEFIKYSGLKEQKYTNSLNLGTRFYRHEQFFDSGRSKWRIPKIWPVEIHNQSQGIITFSLLKYLDSDYLNFARQIALWTIQKMQHPSGYFYYRKFCFYNIKTPLMRWSLAWMMLALVQLLQILNKTE